MTCTSFKYVIKTSYTSNTSIGKNSKILYNSNDSILILSTLIVSGFVLLFAGSKVAFASSQSQQHHQISAWPVLIGYRCESCGREFAENGANILEANTAVTLTLFGESFTTDTIVGFTNKIEPAPNLAKLSSTSSEYSRVYERSIDEENVVAENSIEVNKEGKLEINNKNNNSNNSKFIITTQQNSGQDSDSNNSSLFKALQQARTHEFDCTDYDRVRSYKLTASNIITPNIAKIVINLPEPRHAGMYYYFCLKQIVQPMNQFHAFESILNNSSATLSSSSKQQQIISPLTHIWVHQGGEWYVSLKVETPLLNATYDIVLIIFLLFLSAVTSGLNLGLMSLDMNELAVISSCGDQRERSYARTIAPLRKRGNYLLCSLLLGNVLVNSSLTVILEDLTSGFIAIIGSTLAIVVLGEIVPQAFCARQGLAIGAKTIYLTYAFMIVTFPLSYPISRLLDWVLGEENGHAYDRERLMEFIRITGHHTQLEADEVAIISGALKLKKIKVDQIMTRIEDVFMLPIECKLDRDTIKQIILKGYSRIPVYELNDRRQIIALILAKDLALLDPDDHTPVANMLMYCKHPLIFITDDTTLDVALNEFKTGKSHMAVVRQLYDDGENDKYYEAIGVVTLEDVIEEVLQAEINDETDTLSDNRRKRRRTDAQLAHLIDELTSSKSSSVANQPPSCNTSLNQTAASAGIDVEAGLNSHL